MVGGDPAVLNDCGNTLITASVDLDAGRTAMTSQDTLEPDALGVGGEGSGMELSYAQVCAAVAQAAENLQATLAEDGYYLQRGGRQIDVAMNHCAPPAVGPGGQIPV